jgi:hypothetical protein
MTEKKVPCDHKGKILIGRMVTRHFCSDCGQPVSETDPVGRPCIHEGFGVEWECVWKRTCVGCRELLSEVRTTGGTAATVRTHLVDFARSLLVFLMTTKLDGTDLPPHHRAALIAVLQGRRDAIERCNPPLWMLREIDALR